MIVGSPRSGTTWLGSLFDSHPRTLYLHEPDTVTREPRLPFIPSQRRPDPPAEVIRDYFERLVGTRALRTVFTRESFPKAYRGPAAERLRTSLILSLRVADAAVPPFTLAHRFGIPDLAREAPALTVLKSVDSITRLPAFAAALPEVRFVYLLRHPCGVVRSKQRGVAAGKMSPPPLYDDLFCLPRASTFDPADVRSWPLEEKAAFEWTVTNDWVLGETQALPNVTVASYDDVAAEPRGETNRLFHTFGLSQSAQTEAYLDRLLGKREGTTSDYFAIARNPEAAANEWRTGLSDEEKARVERIAAGTRPAAIFGL